MKESVPRVEGTIFGRNGGHGYRNGRLQGRAGSSSYWIHIKITIMAASHFIGFANAPTGGPLRKFNAKVTSVDDTGYIYVGFFKLNIRCVLHGLNLPELSGGLRRQWSTNRISWYTLIFPVSVWRSWSLLKATPSTLNWPIAGNVFKNYCTTSLPNFTWKRSKF